MSVDVTKIDKNHLVRGSKGTYVDFILIPISNNQYGDDFLVKQEIKDRKEGERGIVIGNARYLKPNLEQVPF